MMNASRLQFIIAIVIGMLVLPRGAEAQSHLEPACSLAAGDETSYEATLAALFRKGYQRTTPLKRTEESVEVILRMAVSHTGPLVSSGEPCITCEAMTGIRVIGFGGQYEAFRLQADTTVWNTEARGPEAVQTIAVHEASAPIDSSLAKRIHQAWQDLLLCPRYPTSGEIHIGAAARFHFSMFVIGIGRIAGGVWLPEDETNADDLATLGRELGAYAKASTQPDRDEAAQELERTLARLERRLDEQGRCPAARARR